MQNKTHHKSAFAGCCSYIYKKVSASISESIIIRFITNMFSPNLSPNKKGVIHLPLKKTMIFSKILRFRVFLAGKYEKSILGGWLSRLYFSFFLLPLRTIALFLMTFGVVLSFGSSLTSSGIKIAPDSTNFFTGVAVTAISILIFPSKKTLYSHLCQSKFLSYLCPEASSIANKSDESLPAGYSSAFFVGLICGLLSFVFTPSKILLFLLALLCTCIIFNYPETGVLLSISFMPIMSTSYVFYFVFITFLAYLFKFLIGKRHFNTDDTDILVFISAAVILFSGIFTISGISGLTHSLKLLFCVLISVTISNLVRSTKTAIKCMSTIIGGAFAVCVFNIILFVFQHTEISNELSLHFSVTDFIGVVNIFSGSNELGVFCAMLIPIVFSFVLNKKNVSVTGYSTLLFMLFINVLISGNTVAFFVSIISSIVALSFKNKLWIALTIPCVVFNRFISAIPSLILRLIGLNSLGNAELSNVSHTSDIMSSISEYGLFGTGLGIENITVSANSVIPAANRSIAFNSLFESAFLSLGLFNMLFFIIMIAVLISKPLIFVVSKNYKDDNAETACIGLISSCISFLLMSMFSYTASDLRLIMLFMVVMSLSFATVKCSRNDHISEFIVREHLNYYQ